MTLPPSLKCPCQDAERVCKVCNDTKRLQLESLLLAGNLWSAGIPREVDNLSFLFLFEKFLSLCLFAFK